MSQPNPWLRRFLVAALVLVIGAPIFLYVCTIPIGSPLPIFVMIDDLPRFRGDDDRTKQIRLVPFDVSRKHVSSEYVVFEGELFLKVQETRRTLLDMSVKRFEWSNEKLEQLFSDHPELKPYGGSL